MSTVLEHEKHLTDLPLRLPALARLRMHQSWTQPQPMSATQVAELWLADLDTPVRLSRWAQGFRNYDLGAFTAEQLAARKSDVLAACDRTDGRVLMLAQPGEETDAPRVYWVLDENDSLVSHVVEIAQAGVRLGMFATGPDGIRVEGTLGVDGVDVAAEGQLRAHLDSQGVRVGLQLTTMQGVPLITMSMSGTLASGSSRALIQSAQRQQAAQRALAA